MARRSNKGTSRASSRRGDTRSRLYRIAGLICVIGLAFVAGVIVGQQSPRPIAETVRAAFEDERPEGEPIEAPVPEETFTFYERVDQPPRESEEGGAQPAGEAEAPPTRRLERTPRPRAGEADEAGGGAHENAEAGAVTGDEAAGDDSGARALERRRRVIERQPRTDDGSPEGTTPSTTEGSPGRDEAPTDGARVLQRRVAPAGADGE